MKKLNNRTIFNLFLVLWFIINLLQAAFTEITNDEAYYALYGKFLSWGYYDHPPMVALLTQISSIFFSGNLGVRFTTVLLQIGTLMLTWSLLEQNEFKTKLYRFFIISASLVMFSAYGFIVTPDVSLLFFTALFLVGYKRFLVREDWTTVLLMTLAMAGLVYSKYQAVIVIGFVVLSNLSLLRNYKFWIAGVTALLFVSPHFYWQYANHFPSLQYHLIDRSEGFNWIYLLEYIPNQLVVFNPFALVAVFYIIFKFKPQDLFERAQYFLIVGFIGFFGLMTYRGHAEPHWTVACSIPMIVLLVNSSFRIQRAAHFIRKYIVPTVVLVFIIRIALVSTLLPEVLGFNGKDTKYEAIHKVAGESPVVFVGSFQKPSLYTFFTGNPSTVVSALESRRTQFDIWKFDQQFVDTTVFVCVADSAHSYTYEIDGKKVEGFFTDHLQVTNDITIHFEMTEFSLKAGEELSIPFIITNPTSRDINFNHSEFPVEICPIFIQGDTLKLAHGKLLRPIKILAANSNESNNIHFKMLDLPAGNYQIGLSLHNSIFGSGLNSNFIKVKVK